MRPARIRDRKMGRTREDIESDIRSEERQLDSVRQRYDNMSRGPSIRSNEWGNLQQHLAQGYAEESAKRYYAQFGKPIEDKIRRLRSELDALHRNEQQEKERKKEEQDLISAMKKANTEEEYQNLAERFRKIKLFALAKECETVVAKMRYERLVTTTRTQVSNLRRFLTNEEVAEFENLIEKSNNSYKAKLESASKQLLKFANQLEAVKELANQLKTNVAAVNHFLTNEQVAEFEKLIGDSDNNLTLDKISNYETKLKDANGQLQRFATQIESVKGCVSQIKTNIAVTNRFLTKEQVTEFEKLIEDSDNNLTLDKISNHEEKLKNASNQLLKLINQIKEVNKLVDELKSNINKVKRDFPNTQITEFEKLIEDYDNSVTLDKISHYKEANRQLSNFLQQAKQVNNLTEQLETNISKAKCFLANEQIAEFQKLIEDYDTNLTFDKIGDYRTKLEKANEQLPQISKEAEKVQEEKRKEYERKMKKSTWRLSGIFLLLSLIWGNFLLDMFSFSWSHSLLIIYAPFMVTMIAVAIAFEKKIGNKDDAYMSTVLGYGLIYSIIAAIIISNGFWSFIGSLIMCFVVALVGGLIIGSIVEDTKKRLNAKR